MVSFFRTLIVLCCAISTAQAALIASVSQQTVSEGDTINLSVSATEGRSDSAPDFTPLTRDFIITNQQQSHNVSITNGNRLSNTTWKISLLPKKVGELTIPSLSLNNERSRPIAISVKPAAKNQTVPATDSILFESSLNRSTVYLGGQSLLTVKIMHRGNLVNGSLSELQADNATLVQTHEASYQRMIDSTPVAVIERVYAVFPESEGNITISGQTLTAELALGSQRSVFGYSNTKTTRRNSKPQTLKVLPLPEFAKNKDTVTADKLSFTQQWSRPVNELQVGDSITRTLLVTATGATGAQIQPFFIDPINGIKIYGDQPELNDEKTQQGIIGSRTESIAYVLTQAGSFEVPAIVLHWVHPTTGKVQSVSVPSTQLKVTPAPVSNSQPNPNNTTTNPNNAANPAIQTVTVSTAPALQHNPWFWVSLSLGVLWLLTLLLLWRTKATKPVEVVTSVKTQSSSKLFKQLLLHAKTNEAQQMLRLFKQWGLSINPQLNSNQLICDFINDDEITKSIQRAERSLYQAGDITPWNGSSLVLHLQQWQKQHAKKPNEPLAPLYQ